MYDCRDSSEIVQPEEILEGRWTMIHIKCSGPMIVAYFEPFIPQYVSHSTLKWQHTTPPDLTVEKPSNCLQNLNPF